jgi:hypothetical protein
MHSPKILFIKNVPGKEVFKSKNAKNIRANTDPSENAPEKNCSIENSMNKDDEGWWDKEWSNEESSSEDFFGNLHF